MTKWAGVALAFCALTGGDPRIRAAAQGAPAGAPQRIDLAVFLASGKLRVVNRKAASVQERHDAVHMTEGDGVGVAWVEGTEFGEGTIEVYLRPFNFRNADAARRENAVQYIASPDYDWPRLRKEFPGEFENPVGAAVDPIGWVPLRIVVTGRTIQVYVGSVTSPTLEVRKLGQHNRGAVGLWTGNGSDGDFANLRITPSKP